MARQVTDSAGRWRRRAQAWAALWLLALAGPAWAEPAAPPAERSGRQLHLAMLNALPADLGTGLSSGAAVRWLQPLGPGQGRWLWGGELSAGSTTEYGASWQVTQRDLRLRAVTGVQAALGRGRAALLLGAGPTVISEQRLRAQGERLGLSGAALEQHGWGALASLDLTLSVAAPVVGAWTALVSAGPALHLGGSDPALGWTTALGVGWMP